jgi:cysteine desulfuration protein SufE
MKSIAEIENEIVEDFNLFDEREDKIDYLIDLGKKLPHIDSKYMLDDFLVKGCQSKVWLHAYEKGGRIFFEADSDSVITKGIIALLVKVLSGQLPTDIIHNNLEFINRIELQSFLTSKRSNGLNSMIVKMKAYASAFA